MQSTPNRILLARTDVHKTAPEAMAPAADGCWLHVERASATLGGAKLTEVGLPKTKGCGHAAGYPCTCAMGNLYRFVEPVVLLLLKKKGRSYGYDLSSELREFAITDAEIERAALYRTLRHLEKNGNVVSEWDTNRSGPARRIYRLTRKGANHLREWATVLDHVAKSMSRFVREAGEARR
jgi:PadR family transcriptional regulator PadR